MADNTLPLLLRGYAWLPDRRRRNGGAPVRTRLLGKRTIALHGPAAVRFFYDEDHIHRRSALPGPVIDTLFGRGAVHTLDGERHRVRKAMFVTLLKDPSQVGTLAEQVVRAWDRARDRWARAERVVLFDEAGLLLTRAVFVWAGVPLRARDVRATAEDLIAMVDGFATPGHRHLGARRARRRQEARIAHPIEQEREHDDHTVDSPFRVVAAHRDADGQLLDPRTAAVEVLNIVRPTVAVSWFVAFAAHALHRWPEHRAPLAGDDTTTGQLIEALHDLVRDAHSLRTAPEVVIPDPAELRPEQVCLPRDAYFSAVEDVPVDDAVGRIAAEMLTPYPPGIPAVVPGERLTEPVLRYLRSGIEAGMNVPDPADPALDTVRVLRKGS